MDTPLLPENVPVPTGNPQTPKPSVTSPGEPAPVTEVGVLGKVDVMSDADLADYQTCEAIISMGWQSFVEVGLALAQIRDRRLYRGEFHRFEDYCRTKWQYARRYADRLISAAELFTYLRTICSQNQPDHRTAAVGVTS